MTEFYSARDIKERLKKELRMLGQFSECALLDYPYYPNIGDHLIWLGTVLSIVGELQSEIKYVATASRFSEVEMSRKVSQDAPIFLQGGGNLGDLWPKLQKFREKIVSRYRDRKIFILAQTIHFQDKENLKEAARAFNSHPDLTIFAREEQSYQIAKENFYKCRILKTPDMAFYLTDMLELNLKLWRSKKLLYHCRADREYQHLPLSAIDLPPLEVADWPAFQWVHRETLPAPQQWYWRLPGSIRLYREGWQRGLSRPLEWPSRYSWEHWHSKLSIFDSLDNPSFHRKSWSYLHAGICQMKSHRLVITNRLHGHILCVLLGIPHVFLPGAYYKNASFYETWTSSIPFCRWVEDASAIKPAIEELLDKFPEHFEI